MFYRGGGDGQNLSFVRTEGRNPESGRKDTQKYI